MATARVSVRAIKLRAAKAFLLRGERAALVDTGTPGEMGKILSAIEAAGVKPGEISLILITHCHTDHTANVAALAAKTGAKVAIHELEADLLARGANAEVKGANPVAQAMIGLFGRFFTLSYPGVEPAVRISGELDLAEHGLPGARVIPTPGHTPGSISVVIQGGEAVVGDLIFGLGPYATLPPLIASEPARIRQSVRAVMASEPTLVHAAHGGPFTPAQVRDRFC